jgi:hypothetical protein
VPDLATTEAVTVSGSLVFNGGGLILAAGKAFTLNPGGYVDTDAGSIVAGSTTIDGAWKGGNTAAVITATSGSSSTIAGVLLSSGGGSISQGTGATNRLDIEANTEISLGDSGVLVLYGTLSAGSASLYFAGQTSVVSLGETGPLTEFTGVTLGGAAGSQATTFGLAYKAAASGSLASIAGSLANTAGSVSAGTIDVFYVRHGGTVVAQ